MTSNKSNYFRHDNKHTYYFSFLTGSTKGTYYETNLSKMKGKWWASMSKRSVKKKKEERYKKNEEEEQRTQTSNKVKMTAEKLWWRHFNKGCGKEKTIRTSIQ